MSHLLIQWDRIRSHWVLILAIALVAAAGAWGTSLVTGTTYTGRAVLTIVSQKRAPEQDTVLAQGYADYFNQPSTQAVLRQDAGVPADTAVSARIAAASPIVYIEATAKDPNLAQSSATRMAVALRDDVDRNLQRTSQARLATLQRQLSTAQAQNDDTQTSSLRDQIKNLQSDTNQLQALNLDAGLASNPSRVARDVGVALLGGLLVGAVMAMVLGRFKNAIATPHEVRELLGLPVLATVDGRRGPAEDARGRLLRSLMSLTDPPGMPIPGSLAITGPAVTQLSRSRVAVAIAGLRALQGEATLLLQTDLESEPPASELATKAGVADFLAESGGGRLDGKVFTNGRGLLVAPCGARRDDPYALFSEPRVARLLRQGNQLSDLTIIDAPPVESAEGQVVCSVADRALLVVEEGTTRAREALDALDALRRAGTAALGVVLMRNRGEMDDPSFLAERRWDPVRLPAQPPITQQPSPAALSGHRGPTRR